MAENDKNDGTAMADCLFVEGRPIRDWEREQETQQQTAPLS